MFDLTVNLGNILQIALYIGGFIGLIFVMRRDVSQMTQEMALMKQELRKITEVLIVQGRQDERITAMDLRMVSQGKRLDDTVRRLNTYLDMKAVGKIEEE